MEEVIRLAHGAGGRMMAELIRDVFASPLDNPYLRQLADSAVVQPAISNPRFAISTDSFVIHPVTSALWRSMALSTMWR